MNRNAIERALEKYAGHKDPTVRADLALWGPLLLEAADISQALRPSDIRANEPTNKELDQAVRGGPTLLSLGLVKIEEAAYADALKRLAAKLLETLKREGRIGKDAAAEVESIDWAPFAGTKAAAVLAVYLIHVAKSKHCSSIHITCLNDVSLSFMDEASESSTGTKLQFKRSPKTQMNLSIDHPYIVLLP